MHHYTVHHIAAQNVRTILVRYISNSYYVCQARLKRILIMMSKSSSLTHTTKTTAVCLVALRTCASVGPNCVLAGGFSEPVALVGVGETLIHI